MCLDEVIGKGSCWTEGSQDANGKKQEGNQNAEEKISRDRCCYSLEGGEGVEQLEQSTILSLEQVQELLKAVC